MQYHEALFRRVVSFDELVIVSDNARRPTFSKSESGESLPPLVLSTSKSNLRRPTSKQCRWNSNNQTGTQKLKSSRTIATITPRGTAPNHLVGSRALLAKRRLLPMVANDFSEPSNHQNEEWQKIENVAQPRRTDSKKIFDHILACPPRKPERSQKDANESSAFLNKALGALQTKDFGRPSIIEQTKCSPMGLRMPQRS